MEMKKETIMGICIVSAAIVAAYAVLELMAKKKRQGETRQLATIQSDINGYNPSKSPLHYPTFYEKNIKKILDKILSFCGLIFLSPLFAIISMAIYLDDPGPIFFTQRRIGKDKNIFFLHKFRSMKMSTPHDVPTHMLTNPEQYITRVGRFLRKSSLDELPQIWDIFRGCMSIVGPRPALWNQDDLVAEREKYGANSVYPGLTGWAQINGRDELEIPVKAKFDGEYAQNISFLFDCKCFISTFTKVASGDGVVEGSKKP